MFKPRTRLIHPGLAINEELAKCSPYARILFPALWCIADREGRLENSPNKIKLFTLPFDDVDIMPLIQELSKAGFLVVYAIDSKEFIQINNWLKYQKIHPHEMQSVIPCNDMSLQVTPKVTNVTQCRVTSTSNSNSTSTSTSNSTSTLVPAKPKPKTEGTETTQIKEYFRYKYQDRYSVDYDFKSAKDGQAIKALLNTYGFEKLKEIVDSFFDTKIKFILDKGHSWGMLRSMTTQIIAEKGNSGGSNGQYGKTGKVTL